MPHQIHMDPVRGEQPPTVHADDRGTSRTSGRSEGGTEDVVGPVQGVDDRVND
jgi:hypothetical protein